MNEKSNEIRKKNIELIRETRIGQLALSEMEKGHAVSLRIDINKATGGNDRIIAGHPALIISNEYGVERIYTDNSKKSGNKKYSKSELGYHFFKPRDKNENHFVLIDLERDKNKKDKLSFCFLLEAFRLPSLSDEMIKSLGLKGKILESFIYEDDLEKSEDFFNEGNKDENFIDLCNVGFYLNRYPYFQLGITGLFTERKREIKSVEQILLPDSHFFGK